MTKPRIISDDEQISWIDRAVAEGWSVVEVTTGFHGHGVVKFAKGFAPPYPPKPIRYDGWETVTQEWGCGLAACAHARNLMAA